MILFGDLPVGPVPRSPLLREHAAKPGCGSRSPYRPCGGVAKPHQPSGTTLTAYQPALQRRRSAASGWSEGWGVGSADLVAKADLMTAKVLETDVPRSAGKQFCEPTSIVVAASVRGPPEPQRSDVPS